MREPVLLHGNIFGFLKKTGVCCVSGNRNLFQFLSIRISIPRYLQSPSFRNMKLQRRSKLRPQTSYGVPDAAVIVVFLYKKLNLQSLSCTSWPARSYLLQNCVLNVFVVGQKKRKKTAGLRTACSWAPSGLDVSCLIYFYRLSCRV